MTDPQDDLRSRLDRLAPPVDVEAALLGVHASTRRRQTRHQQLVGLAVAVVLVVLVSGMALARQDGGDAAVVASDPDVSRDDADDGTRFGPRRSGTTVPGTTVVDEPLDPIDPSAQTDPGGGPVRSSTTRPPTTNPRGASEPDGPVGNDSVEVPPEEQDPTPDTEPGPPPVEVVITPTEAMVAVGERMTFWVDITNRGSTPVRVNAGECGSVEVISPNGGSESPAVPGWNPAATGLTGYAATHDLRQRAYPTEPSWGGMQRMCSTTNLQPTLGYTTILDPGEATSHIYVWDVAVLPPVAGPISQVEIRARVRFPQSADPHDESSRPAEYSSAFIPVADRPGAHASPATFLAAVDANAIVDGWLAANPAGTGGYRVVLSFLRGSFELWIDNGTTRVRVRGSVTNGAIEEIRSLGSDWLPSDDPSAWSGDPNEVILFPT